jgi:hypothetical protein
MKRVGKIILTFLLSIIGILIVLVVISALSNVGLPQKSQVVESLSEADKIRLAETRHLRQELGDLVWPGWAEADIPVILYNEAYAFITGYPDPPSGWVKVPIGLARGGLWEIVPDDTLYGQPYYRQALTDPGVTPEAFTVLVGDRWVASLQTYDWATIRLAQPIRQDLPGFLRPIFPYRLFIGQLLGNSDKYITLISHEAFHAFEGMLATEKLASAENVGIEYENHYPWENTSLGDDWQQELDLLAEALKSNDPSQVVELTRQFLDLRSARRSSAKLSAQLIAYEEQREWEEGLARYAELEIWRQADKTSYTPLPETDQLNNFDDYAGFEKRWSQEIQQMPRMADDEGDGRFYYTGMAQAYLLDQLMPGWKTRAFEEGVWLDDLLAEAVQGIPN